MKRLEVEYYVSKKSAAARRDEEDKRCSPFKPPTLTEETWRLEEVPDALLTWMSGPGTFTIM